MFSTYTLSKYEVPLFFSSVLQRPGKTRKEKPLNMVAHTCDSTQDAEAGGLGQTGQHHKTLS